jgi:hypothetical protein
MGQETLSSVLLHHKQALINTKHNIAKQWQKKAFKNHKKTGLA